MRSLFILSISSSQKLPPFCKLLFNRCCFFFFFPLLLLLFFLLLLWLLLHYFTLALTLTLNFAYCCRRWRSLKTITRFVLFHWFMDGDGSAMPYSSYSPFPRFLNLCLSRSFLNFFSFVFISHFFFACRNSQWIALVVDKCF